MYQNTAFAVGLLKMENKENSKWYRGGRPKMDEEEKATKRVQIRFTPEEYEQLAALKKKTRTATMSDFIRRVCLHKPIRARPERTTYQENALGIMRETRTDAIRISVTVSQAARHIINTTNDEHLRKEAELVWAELARLDVNLRAVLAAIYAQGDGPK